MGKLWSRRGAAAAIGAFCLTAFVQPAAAEGALARVKAAGVLKIGIADNLPWSKLNPDGSLTGIAPIQVRAVAARMGIPKVEAVVATYGQLIPGLLAGRWDMVGAALSISPERCAQVLFADPFYRADEGEGAAFLPGTVKDLPKSFADMSKQFERIGMSTGARVVIMQKVLEKTGGKAEIVMFTDSQLMLEGLLTKRVPVITTDEKTMEALKARAGAAIETVRVDSGEPSRGSGGAFRKEDTDLRDAFVVEQRKLKESGEVKKILAEFNYVYDEKFMSMSGDEACKL